MQPAESGSGECRSANNARGARRASAGTSVNSTSNRTSANAAASSRPTFCWTGAGSFSFRAQHAIPWQQHFIAHAFAHPTHPPADSATGPAAMLNSIASTASSRVMAIGVRIRIRVIIATCVSHSPSHFPFVKPTPPDRFPRLSKENPFSIGFRAARANLIPGLIIQALMVALVLAYYFFPPSHAAFQALAAAKGRWGYGFSFASAVVAGAVLPVIFKITVLQRGRVTRADFADLLFLALFWGVDGVILDSFYRLQAVIFGAHADFPTVCKKVLVDQFIYNPVFAAPYAVICYELKHQGFRWRRGRHVFTAAFYRERTIPTLCATWTIWIPVTTAIYALPSLLQIPLFALALTFWVLMLAYITARPHTAEPVPAPLPQPVDE